VAKAEVWLKLHTTLHHQLSMRWRNKKANYNSLWYLHMCVKGLFQWQTLKLPKYRYWNSLN